MLAKSIQEVINILEQIIQESKTNQSPLGYFAALYKKVTVKVKEGIVAGDFDDNERMEKLDVTFANRYLEAYFAYQKKEKITLSWKNTFEFSTDYWPIVLQHLLLGMNAHINLDLGIATAEVMEGKDVDLIQNDFNKINKILSELVSEVEEELSKIWPNLKKILVRTQKVNGFLVDFSMKLARDGAWIYAKKIHQGGVTNREALIAERDEKVSKHVSLIINQYLVPRLIFAMIRLGERGDISNKIEVLEA